jgi:Bacterial PH domain
VQEAGDFRPELHPDERIVWTGRPDPKALLGPGDLFLIPFSVFWLGFAVVWEAGVIASRGGSDGAPWFAVLWGLPFIGAGLYFMLGRFVVKRVWRRRTAYAVTTERIMIRSSWPRLQTRTIRLRDIPSVEVTMGRRGLGTIAFGPPVSSRVRWADSFSASTPWRSDRLSLEDIPDAPGVARQIERLRHEAR